ncbi:MAG TPA: hypothetical protein VFE07_11465 [Marmoricola sp.]|jgi:hypothetical protein|nr:hypothetical protein [Marmoricola sp.]
MTWNTFHHRGAILQTVVETADRRRDGLLPMQLPGVTETFRDELDLLAALQLKWHARLSGNIERALMSQPLDLEDAIASAWRRTSDQLPGVRKILDRYAETPSSSAMAAALARANEKEWIRLAAAAGLASDESAAAARAGRQVELRARSEAADAAFQRSAEELLATATTDVATPILDEDVTPSLVERIKAVLAA